MTPPYKSSGYKKTPDHTKFKKGRSGNPKGRPKGAKGIKTLLANELKAPVSIQQDGKTKQIPRQEAIMKGLVNDALRGRDRPRETVLRYAEAIEADQREDEAAQLSEEDQAILDRYFERRLARMQRKNDYDI